MRKGAAPWSIDLMANALWIDRRLRTFIVLDDRKGESNRNACIECFNRPCREAIRKIGGYASIGVMKPRRPLPPIHHFDVGQDDNFIDRVSRGAQSCQNGSTDGLAQSRVQVCSDEW